MRTNPEGKKSMRIRVTNLELQKGSSGIGDQESGLQKVRLESWITNPANFQSILVIFMIFMNPHES